MNDCVVQKLLQLGSPLTQQNYLRLAYWDDRTIEAWVQKNWRSFLTVSRNGLEPKRKLTDGDVPNLRSQRPSV